MNKNKESGLSILVIEDNDMFRRLAIEMLAGNKIASARNASEGIAMFTKKYPDIIFLDIGLPDRSGHDVLKEIIRVQPDAFVVMLTASNLKSDVKRSKEEGVKGYITKPFSRKQINDCIELYYNHIKILSLSKSN